MHAKANRMQTHLTVTTTVRRFAIRGKFRIARGERTHAEVVETTVSDGVHRGIAECVPYAHYGETLDSVAHQIADMPALEADIDAADMHQRLRSTLPPGAARNGVDCALWDYHAKRSEIAVHRLVCRQPPRPLDTAITLSVDRPEAMADAARGASGRRLIKIKLAGDEHDIARMHAVAANAGTARIIVDANESWPADQLTMLIQEAAHLHVALIEQPLPAGNDQMLADIPHPVPICADESAHVATDLEQLGRRYDVVNIKLDKAGGLTEALEMRDRARQLGFGVMIGCMVGSSLAMAPAVLLAQDADYVDLDGPLLLDEDRKPALHYFDSTVSPPLPKLWG